MKGDGEYRAFIEDDWQTDPFAGTVRLHLYRRPTYGGAGAYLGADGFWHEAVEGATSGGSGFRLPAETISAIAEAIERRAGSASHGATEAAVLREWLAVEQRRVDEALKR